MAYILSVFAGVTLIPLVLSEYGHPQLKVLLATALLGVCAYPTAHYFANREKGLPAFQVLCLAYAIQFAVPIFTREPALQLAYARTVYLADEDVIDVLLLSILGVGSLVAGYYGFQATRLAKGLPAIDLHLNEKKAFIYCVVIAILTPSLAKADSFLPESIYFQLFALIKILQNQSLVAIAILGCLIYSGRGLVRHRIVLYWIIGLTVTQGLSTGMVEQTVAPIATLFIVRWQMVKRPPVLGIAVVAAIVIFLSPVKHEYRKMTWSEETPGGDSPLNKALLWTEQASQYWADTLSGRQSFGESTEQAASRMDLIHQFALVRSLTPSEVPYQYGATYSYFLVTFIPRALWPEKPEAGAANKFFGVNYGLTTEQGIEKTTFGVSLLAESYINFGLIGVILGMACQGAILGLLQHLFGEWDSGEGGRAVYVSFFVFFLNGIGSSADMLFGNVIQSALLSCALLWWMRAKPPAPRRQENSAAEDAIIADGRQRSSDGL